MSRRGEVGSDRPRGQTSNGPDDLEYSPRASEVGPHQARNCRHGQGRWAGLEDRAGEIGPRNRGIRLVNGPGFRIGFEEGHCPGQALGRLPEPPPERRGETWWPCPPGRACSRDSPLPDIGVPAPPMAFPRTGGPPTPVDPLSPAVFRARSSRTRPRGWLGERRVAPAGQGARGPRRRFAQRAP